MNMDREAIRNAVSDLRAKLDALTNELDVEPFGASYDEILRTQTNISRWSRRNLVPKMIDLLIAAEDAGCDTPPRHSVVGELAETIDTALTEHYDDAHEDVRERAASARTLFGRAEVRSDREREDRRAA